MKLGGRCCVCRQSVVTQPLTPPHHTLRIKSAAAASTGFPHLVGDELRLLDLKRNAQGYAPCREQLRHGVMHQALRLLLQLVCRDRHGVAAASATVAGAAVAAAAPAHAAVLPAAAAAARAVECLTGRPGRVGRAWRTSDVGGGTGGGRGGE